MVEKYCWEKYLNIEKDFINAKRYVDFVPSNYSSTSDFFSNQVVLLGSLIESGLKHLAHINNPSCSTGNIGEIKGEVLKIIPNIIRYETRIIGTSQIFTPYAGWDTGNLPWWSDYVNVKHNITPKNMKIAFEMLSAYLVLLFVVHSREICPNNVAQSSEYIEYTVSEMPRLLTASFSYRQRMGGGNYYFCFPVSQFL